MKHYDFRLNGAVVGTFELSEKPGWIHQNATFTSDGRQQANTFAVRLDHTRPIAVRGTDGTWLDVDPGVYPSAAWPLVLRRGLREYDRLDESTGQVMRCCVKLEDGLHVEYVDGVPDRKFRIEDGLVTYISWGPAAESYLLQDGSETAQRSR